MFAFLLIENHLPFVGPSHTLSRSTCNSLLVWLRLILLYIFESSSKSFIVLLIMSGMSLINIRNSDGPNTLPWGTPLVTGAHSECVPLINTLCFLSCRKLFIHFSTFPLIPYPNSFFSSSLWEILSNCSCKVQEYYVNIITVVNGFHPSSMTSKSWVTHDRPDLNPC